MTNYKAYALRDDSWTVTRILFKDLGRSSLAIDLRPPLPHLPQPVVSGVLAGLVNSNSAFIFANNDLAKPLDSLC